MKVDAMRITFVLLVCFSAAIPASAADDRPNVVFILADDLGIGDVKCYGKQRCQIDTPNIDALAAGGLRFTDAHVNASVCRPSRRSLMTGRYSWRFAGYGRGGPWGYCGLSFPPETFTLGDLFQRSGYRTNYVGKWHLGTVMTTVDGKVQKENNVDYTQPLQIGPPQFGFDESFILPGSLDMYPYAFIRNNVWQGEITARKGWSAFNRVGPAEKDFEDHRVLETFYRLAETTIADQPDDRPFFLFLALTAPHTPISPGKSWLGKSKLGVYGDLVMEVDHSVERVVRALKQKGCYDNTLILFSSDHGPGPYAGNILKATLGQIRLLEKQGHYAVGPHRGYKFSVYEGGLRVPLVAHWPRVIPAGSESASLIGLNDLMATFAEILNETLDPAAVTDSISFANLLRDPAAKPRRTNLIMQSVGPFVVRDGKWKLCICPGSGTAGGLGNEPTAEHAWRSALQRFGRVPRQSDLSAAPFVQLFDMERDLHEDHNLAAEHPEKVAELVALLQSQIDNGRSTPGPSQKNGQDDISIHQRVPGFVRKLLRD